MAVNTVSQPPALVPSPPPPKPEPVNADGSAIPDEILYHHRPRPFRPPWCRSVCWIRSTATSV